MPKKSLMVWLVTTVLFAAGGTSISQEGKVPFKDPAPMPATKEEQKILDVLSDMYINQRRGMMNVQPEDGRMLRLLTEAVGAKHVVEIGTSNGYSGIWFCLALRATRGRLTTYEIDAGRASLARENFKRAGVDGLVTLIEGDAHEEVTKLIKPIDILHLDADKAGYLDYLDKLLPFVRPGGLILAHNTTNLGSSMRDYIKAVTSNPMLETKFIHKHDQGIGITLKKRTSPTPKAVDSKVKKGPTPDVVFVPTPQNVVDKMLELANVKKDDLVYDLGCGDGRIVVTAAKRFGCKAVGYDIDPQRVEESLENVERNNVGHLVSIEQKDIFTLDLSKASVVTLYLLPDLNVKLIPQLQKLKPGSRIVSHDFRMKGVKPDKVVKLYSDEDNDRHKIYLWTSPLKMKEKTQRNKRTSDEAQ